MAPNKNPVYTAIIAIMLASNLVYAGKKAIIMPRGRHSTAHSAKPTCLADAPPFIQAHPALTTDIFYTKLGQLPTPLEQAPAALTSLVGAANLLIKRDDQAGQFFGGSKVRKLEFLLGDATTKKAHQLVTWGAHDSNHVAATAVYTDHLKLPCTCMYIPENKQHNSTKNLPLIAATRLVEEYYPSPASRELTMRLKNRAELKATGQGYYFIPEGGACTIGAIGFVNAAFELKNQLAETNQPNPDYIYIVSGTGSSAAGLMLGLELAGFTCTLVPVALTPNTYDQEQESKITGMAQTVREYLALIDDDMALWHERHTTTTCTLDTSHGFTKESALLLDQAMPTIIPAISQLTGFTLDPIYGNKLFTALVLDSLSGKLAGKRVLLWNTGPLKLESVCR